MVEPQHRDLSIARQCRLLSLNRSSYDYRGRGEMMFNLRVMRLIDEQYLATP